MCFQYRYFLTWCESFGCAMNWMMEWELILSKHGYDMKSDSIMYSPNSIDINTTIPVKCEQTIIH